MKAKSKKSILLIFLMMVSLFSFGILQYSPSSVQAEDCISCIKETPPYDEFQGAWIIFGGDTWDHRDMDSIQNACNITYEVLRGNGFTSEQIFYMGPEVDPVTQPYVNWSSTKASLQYAIETWAPQHVSSDQGLGITIFTHGNVDALAVMVGDVLWASTFSTYLDNFETATGCKRIIVVIEACHSGSFIDNVSKDNRIIVTSAQSIKGASFNVHRTNGLFSESFWSSIASCETIGRAFEIACNHVINIGSKQAPQLDDNHDGWGNTVPPYSLLPLGGDGFDALNVRIQGADLECSPKISIGKVPLHMYEIWDPFASIFNIEVEVNSTTGISQVLARFIPLDWEPVDPLDGYMYPINDASIRIEELESPLMNGVYSVDGAFDSLALGDSFIVNILAYDDDGMVSDVVNTYLSFNADGEPPEDTEVPSIAILMPPPDDNLNGIVDIIAQGDDNQALENIDLYIDGLLVDSLAMPDYYPYPKLQFMCNTSLYGDGVHNITAVAIDTVGLVNQTSILVNFENQTKGLSYYSSGVVSGFVIIGSVAAIVRFLMRRKVR
jgi:hypothetical protein